MFWLFQGGTMPSASQNRGTVCSARAGSRNATLGPGVSGRPGVAFTEARQLGYGIDIMGQALAVAQAGPGQADVGQHVVVELLELAQIAAGEPVADHPPKPWKGKGPVLECCFAEDIFAHGRHLDCPYCTDKFS